MEKLFNGQLNKVMYITMVLHIMLSLASAVEYSEKNEGYANNFMPICPGVDKPAHIKPEHLDKIKISVLGDGHLLLANWTSYTYHKVKDLVKDSNMDLKRRTVLYCPGYLESTALPVGRILMTMYKKLGYNVLILEYVTFTTNIFPVTIRMMRPVGKHVAEMLANLMTVGVDPKNLELVGLSLGGVSMSFIAKNFQRITGRNISQITALDPTGPCIRHLGPEGRLDPSDADFVLFLASNIGGYGMATPIGHVSVYINGGEFQPSLVPLFICDDLCSHTQAFLMWYSALQNPGKFIMMQCDSLQQARDHNCYDRKPMATTTLDRYMNKNKTGIYYLATSPRYPYYLGKKGLKRNGSEMLKHISDLNSVDVLRV